ncbi:MAG: hypothetical protein U5K30_02330 [Acidimicrobiales bacterium]|nr:hypothetical protein [Acidimicrobiales bacterium]
MSDRRDPTSHVTDTSPITDRLARLAAQPVPDDVRGAHMHRMAAATPDGPAPKRFGRLAVAGAAIIGFFAGSTGFAMAGALPGPAQGAAHDVLSVLQVDVPDRPGNGNGPPDFILDDPCKGPPPWAIDKDMTAEDKAAAQAERRATCGTDDAEADDPEADGNGRPEGIEPGGPPQSILDDPCKGPPPWAIDKDMTAEDKAAAQAERRATCGTDDAEADDPEADGNGRPEGIEPGGPPGNPGPPEAPGSQGQGSNEGQGNANPGPPGNSGPPEDPGSQGQGSQDQGNSDSQGPENVGPRRRGRPARRVATRHQEHTRSGREPCPVRGALSETVPRTGTFLGSGAWR